MVGHWLDEPVRPPAPMPSGQGDNSGRLLIDGLSMRPIHHPFTTLHLHHELRCPVSPPRPPRAQILIPFSTPLSKPTRRRPGKTSPHIPLLPNFNPAILLIQYSPSFEGKYPHSINPRVGMKDLQNVSLQSSTFFTRLTPPLAMVLVW